MSTTTPTSPILTSPTCGPRPLQLVDSNVPSALASPTSIVLSSPRASSHGLSTPPPSARGFRQNSRRQSSISYFPSDHVSIRSPTAATSRRSNSLGIWGEEGQSAVSKVKGDRGSMGASIGTREPLSPGPLVEHGPLTLAEKHADLLQFIAQKESKCLELRSQLALHEAELTQLKKKWERIVSRGMDRAYSTTGPASTLSTPPSSANHTATSVSSIIPTASAALKEGARLLAAGLDLSAPEPGSPSPSPYASAFTSPVMPMSGFATVSRASMASPAVKRITTRHAATQSLSSVSTASSSTNTSTAQSQRLSQSSASSLLSSLSLEDPIEENCDSASDAKAEDHTITVASTPERPSASERQLRRRSQEPRFSLPSSPLAGDLPKKAMTSVTTPSQSKTKARPTSPGSLSTPVSAWMGNMGNTVNRKWEEIQKGETFTKSQKRASLLLSDVSQSLFAALASPTPSNGSSPLIKSSPLSATVTSSTTSLLDEPEPESEQKLGAIMVPSVVSSSPVPAQSPVQPSIVDDDDDWNW